MKQLFTLLLLISISGLSYAQNPALLQAQISLGGISIDQATSIEQTKDGGCIIAGITYSNDGDVSGNHGGYDYWIVKLSRTGSIQWQKSLGGSWNEIATSIKQTKDGGYIVAGSSTSNDGDVSGLHGTYNNYSDGWIVKIDADGNIQWQKCLGGSNQDGANAVLQTADGGYIVAGFSNSNNGDVSGHHGTGDYTDYWIVKLDAAGNIQRQKCLGGSFDDVANNIEQTKDGSYIIAGYSFSNDDDVSGNHGNGDYWIIKLNASGSIKWQKCLGGTNYDGAYSIRQTKDGGYVVAGSSGSIDGDVSGNHGNADCWIVKLDNSGNIQGQKSFGGTNYDGATSIQQAKDGGYIVAGSSLSNDGDVSGHHGTNEYPDYWIIKLDATTNIQWQKSLGGTNYDEANSIQRTTDGGYIVAGFSYSKDGDITGHHGTSKYSDYWIVKLSATGNLVSPSGVTASAEKINVSSLRYNPIPCIRFYMLKVFLQLRIMSVRKTLWHWN